VVQVAAVVGLVLLQGQFHHYHYYSIVIQHLLFSKYQKISFLCLINLERVKKNKNIPLPHQPLRFFDEILDQDRKKYNDIFVHNFLFVYLDDLQHWYVNQDHIQYEISLVLFLF
jgi:hypothetical protein